LAFFLSNFCAMTDFALWVVTKSRRTLTFLYPMTLNSAMSWLTVFTSVILPKSFWQNRNRTDKLKHIRVIASDPGKEYPLVVTKQLDGR